MNLDKIQYQLRTKRYEDNGVTLITPTGDREIALARSMYYLARQTYSGAIQWIVADDSQQPYLLQNRFSDNIEIVHIHNQPFHDKARSITGNVLSALEHIRYKKILIWEDDDWYAPKYIESQLLRLNDSQLVGEGCARYYNIRKRMWRKCGNTKSASFCQTALRSDILYHLYVSCLKRDSSFIDARLWTKDVSRRVFQDTVFCVGIKGMPGRLGVGIGHRPTLKGFIHDPKGAILEKWIGKQDTEWYFNLLQTTQ